MTNVKKGLRRVVDEPRDRFGLLLGLLVTAFVVSGLDNSVWIRLVVSILNLLSVLVALGSTELRYRYTKVTAFVVFVAVGGVVVSPFRGSAQTSMGSGTQVVVLTVVILAVLRRILEHPRVTVQTILGAISVYFLIGQVFAWLYLSLPGYTEGEVLDPTTTDEIPMYFSYTVLSTLGFGDIVPMGALAQRLAVLEALIGQLFLAVLVARLVSLYSRPGSGDDTVASG